MHSDSGQYGHRFDVKRTKSGRKSTLYIFIYLMPFNYI